MCQGKTDLNRTSALDSAFGQQKKARADPPGLLRIVKRVQAAGCWYLAADALIGSTVSVATFWPSSASSLAWAEKVSNCFLACEVHSSMAAAGVFTLSSSCAKSSEVVVFVLKNSSSLAE